MPFEPTTDESGDAMGSLEGAQSTKKQWRQRVCAPDVTFSRLRPFFKRMQITRVADVTELDHIGIPVAQAVRPMSRSLSVAQGKGMTLAAAMTSAAMEAAEGWHAEHIELKVHHERVGRVNQAFDVMGLSMTRPLKPEQSIDWAPGTDLATGDDIWVPADLVSKDYTQTVAPQLERSTNGLASGNTWAEAVASALHEVIERDCHADYTLLPKVLQRKRLRSLNWARALGPDPARLINLVEAAGLKLFLSDLTNHIGVPCVQALLMDAASYRGAPPRRPSLGTGCHLDPQIAAVRAITEAAQSRLTDIAGARDDIPEIAYSTPADANIAHAIDLEMDLVSSAGQAALSQNAATDAAEGDVTVLINRLAAAGHGQVGIVDLSRFDMPIHVVRAFVPGLGFPTRDGFFKPKGALQ